MSAGSPTQVNGEFEVPDKHVKYEWTVYCEELLVEKRIHSLKYVHSSVSFFQKGICSYVQMKILLPRENLLQCADGCTPPLRLRCGFVGLRLAELPEAESDCGEVYTINNQCK